MLLHDGCGILSQAITHLGYQAHYAGFDKRAYANEENPFTVTRNGISFQKGCTLPDSQRYCGTGAVGSVLPEGAFVEQDLPQARTQEKRRQPPLVGMQSAETQIGRAHV